jgi:dolichol-phosphate mannosyltransferase
MRFEEKLALVIPTLNEAECLPRMLALTRGVLDRLSIACEILVVDDESRDETRAIAEAIAAEDPRIRLLVRRGERGLAGAVLYGWQHTDASVLGVMDADLQHPPELLPELLAAMRAGADAALASRYTRQGRGTGWSGLRRAISQVSIWLARPLQKTTVPVKDPLSGYFLVRRQCVASIPFRSSGFKLLLEILMRGRIGRVVEVPFEFGRRKAGYSKAGLSVAWDYLLLLGSLYVARLRATGMMAGTSAD